jgi:pimeloyl-ACP methyl ester carboxylesterase
VSLATYTGYVGVAGADRLMHPDRSTDCRTPVVQYGWPYEAINYDIRTDAALDPDTGRCEGGPAGDAVVTSDGVRIAGWYIPAATNPDPTGPTLILAAGMSSNKSAFLRYAVPFHDTFNIVIVDLRNTGQSGGQETTGGLRERDDIAAVVDWLVRTKRPRWIAGVGNSLGAAALLAAAASDPRLEALVLDSMHARFVEAAGRLLETEHGHPAVPGSWAIAVVVSLRLGTDITLVDPVRTITRLGDRPVLLLHGRQDRTDPPDRSAELNYRAALDAGVPVELRYCADAGHEAVLRECPTEWSRWATEFLAAAGAG